ncbi:hypothetical protein RN001_013328 [Aquatica leii]|uniref:Uncharacterized protein n=1 Tax=Aquatica leii TaxID=1421715 RepID=A0AAN7P2N9_9COLE|nr:hypothetical protein RN001_013328 [Aquatica leii]
MKQVLERRKFLINKTKPHLEIRNWSLKDGYIEKYNNNVYPRRALISGSSMGFTADWLYSNHSHIDHLCKDSVLGFKVKLDHPLQIPYMNKYFIMPLNKITRVAIKPVMTLISEELVFYKPIDRQCYLPDEMYLSLYKIYSQQNCFSECLYNVTLRKCGCVPYWMPHVKNTKICGPGKTDCMKDIHHLQSDQFKSGPCKCLPLCNSLKYEIETSHTDWNWDSLPHTYNISNECVV